MPMTLRTTGLRTTGLLTPFARLLAVVGLAVVLPSCGVSATGGWSGSVPGGDGAWARTVEDLDLPSGPLYPADVKLLVAVAQAGLWEGPASEVVARRSTNPRVRAVAAQLAREHHKLNEINARAAARVHVPLPDAPTPQQQAWRERIEAADDSERDQLYVKLTRAAHGSVYMKIATVRATTQNDVIRSAAQISSDYVARHMRLLESTKLANLDSLAVHSGSDAQYQLLPSATDVVLGIGLALAAGFVVLGLVQVGARQAATPSGGDPIE